MKKIVAIGAGIALTISLAGCSSAPAEDSTAKEQPAQEQKAPESKAAAMDFDGSKCSDTGAGTMYLRTAGGTSEDGKVPEIAGGASVMQIELDTDGMDGSVCTVYIDGMQNTTMNASERTQQSITLESAALEAGAHTVELVAMEGDTPTVYKKAEYKVA